MAGTTPLDGDLVGCGLVLSWTVGDRPVATDYETLPERGGWQAAKELAHLAGWNFTEL